ncbi:hypothetical protein HDA32_001348 [Spinactinospora alkalitolerans]|uniref:Uncharacterized protein n=1 Tax=Spinactinospora alkalitolerans TaxID=687207 RepID=A0A852TQK1_9ACTN|nr:hypothetical protein [Spinactinospora alkalitolerans]NYE46228.1 hypothetical protein [Spinactinospora alkalitolerans]
MPVSSTVRDRVRALLPAGAEIRYIFPASWHETSFFLVVVTESTVTVVANRMFSRTRPRNVWQVFERGVRIGPVDTHLVPTFELGGREFEVHEEYVPVINAADAELAGRDALPPDPLADL